MDLQPEDRCPVAPCRPDGGLEMGRVELVLDDKLETRFRREVALRLGMKKGNLSAAAEEALSDWMTKKKAMLDEDDE
jgi:hypothetical protein